MALSKQDLVFRFGVLSLSGQIGGAIIPYLGEGSAAYHQYQEKEMEQRGDGPCDGIGQKEAGGSMVEGEDGGYPEQA